MYVCPNKNIKYVLVVDASTCKENEMFVECAHCGPKSCDDLGHPIPCRGNLGICRSECVCVDGFVRDANDTCILKKECRKNFLSYDNIISKENATVR